MIKRAESSQVPGPTTDVPGSTLQVPQGQAGNFRDWFLTCGTWGFSLTALLSSTMAQYGAFMLRATSQSVVSLIAVLLTTSGFSLPYQQGPVQDGGTISGDVVLHGPAPEPLRFKVTRGSDPEFCKRIADEAGYVTLTQVRITVSHRLADVVVFIQEIAHGKPFPPEGPLVTIDQCRFQPFVTAGLYGRPLRLETRDEVIHQIRGWEMLGKGRLSLFHLPHLPVGQQQSHPLKIRRSSVVKLECDQHRFMQAWVLVAANPYFAVTGDRGGFELADVPAGQHTIGAWHPILGYQETSVTVRPGERKRVTFTFPGASSPR